jgi:hypothetical protein
VEQARRTNENRLAAAVEQARRSAVEQARRRDKDRFAAAVEQARRYKAESTAVVVLPVETSTRFSSVLTMFRS